MDEKNLFCAGQREREASLYRCAASYPQLERVNVPPLFDADVLDTTRLAAYPSRPSLDPPCACFSAIFAPRDSA
jgi:hypothetical protein